MTSMPESARKSQPPVVFACVDTHKELHVAAVITPGETVLATRSFPTTRAGYRAMLTWIGDHGTLARIGIEGTGSYGAGLTRHLAKGGVTVPEVDRPDRSDRRREGRDDDLDAINAARAALHHRRTTIPKSKDGAVESLRILRVTLAHAVRERRSALQLLRMSIISAPEELRDQVRHLTRMRLIRTLAAWRPDVSNATDPTTAYRVSLKSLERRYLELSDEIADLDELINPIVEALAPKLLERVGIGIEIAGQLLVTAGDNLDRMKSEAAFAMLCGVSPLPASSGMTQRHRLNRGGDRQANRALHLAAISRLRLDLRTRTYVAKKTAEGHRCIFRICARTAAYDGQESGGMVTPRERMQMPGRPRQDNGQVQGAAASLLNGLAVLEAFSVQKPVLGVTEVAQRVGLHKSTVSRILSGLTEAGYVQRDEETGRYRLGLGLLALSGPLLADLDVRRAAVPYLEQLTESTQETSAISVWNGHEAIVVEQVASPHQVKHTATIGTRYNKFESSSVRVFLAELAPSLVTELIGSGQILRTAGDGLPLDHTTHLQEVALQGYAVNDGSTAEEEFGVSAPVRDYRGKVVGCITAAAPFSRVHKHATRDTLVQAVQHASSEVSTRLGWSGSLPG